MAAYTDQDEVEKLKAWWKDYGAALVVGVLIGLALLFGNKYWTEYKERQRLAASDLYAAMLEQVNAGKIDAVRTHGDKLISEYDGTPYAGMAALLLARINFEANDAAATRKNLEWAVKNATDPAVEHTARLRLARLLLASSEHEAALALIPASLRPGFEGEYLELKGDIYLAQGKRDDARTVYTQALEQMSKESPYRRVLTMKLDDLRSSASQ